MENLCHIIETAQWSYSRRVALSIGGKIHEGENTRAIETGVVGLDRIYTAHLCSDEARAESLNAMKRFRRARNPFWVIHYNCCGAGDPGGWLEAHGMRHLFDWRAMAADLRKELPPQRDAPTPLTITRVAGPELLRIATEITAEAFSLHDTTVKAFRNMTSAAKAAGSPDGLAQYIGYVDGEPLGSATIYADEGTAGIYWVGTLVAARRRGVAEALVRHLMRRGREAGCRYAALQATAAGQRLYTRLGFVDCCPVQVWGWSPE